MTRIMALGLASIIIWPVILFGLVVSFTQLPPIYDRPGPPFSNSTNWLGQGQWFILAYAASLFLFIYLVKWCLVRCCRSKPVAAYWYAVLVAASLPYIWFLLEIDWV